MILVKALIFHSLLALAACQETALLNDLDEREPCYFAYQLFQQLAISQQNLVSVINKLSGDIKGVQDELQSFRRDINGLRLNVETLGSDVTKFKDETTDGVAAVHDNIMDIKAAQEDARNDREQLAQLIYDTNNVLKTNISTKQDQFTEKLDTLSLQMTSMKDLVQVAREDLATSENKTLTVIGDIKQSQTECTNIQYKFRENITTHLLNLKETVTATRRNITEVNHQEMELMNQVIQAQNLIQNRTLDILSSNRELQLQVQTVNIKTVSVHHAINQTLNFMEDFAQSNQGSNLQCSVDHKNLQDTISQNHKEVVEHLQGIQNFTLLPCSFPMNTSGGSGLDHQLTILTSLGVANQRLFTIISTQSALKSSLDDLSALVTYKLGMQTTPSPDPTTTPTITPPHVPTPTPPQLPSDPNIPLLLPERPLEPWEPHPLNWYTEAPDSALRKACFIRVAVNQVSSRASLVVRAVSSQIQNPPEQPPPSYGEYWIQTRDRRAHLCLQYKCPGHVFDPDVPSVQINGVATRVQVYFTGAQCTVREENHLVADGVSSTPDGFVFLADPDVNYNSTYGIYTGTGSGQRMQTKAIGYCRDGDVNAVHMECSTP